MKERLDDEWRQAARAWRRAKKAIENAKQRLIDLAGDVSSYGAGVKYTYDFKRGNVDYDKIPELQGVDREPYRRKGHIEIIVKAI